MWLDFDEELRGMLRCSDGRWTESSNVHIVSYWRWPRSVRELRQMVANAAFTYNALCGAHLK